MVDRLFVKFFVDKVSKQLCIDKKSIIQKALKDSKLHCEIYVCCIEDCLNMSNGSRNLGKWCGAEDCCNICCHLHREYFAKALCGECKMNAKVMCESCHKDGKKPICWMCIDLIKF